jgi:hypothetical protein
MIFKGLNQNRLRFLFLEALGASALKEFLDQNRKKLTALGAQFHKRSKGAAKEVDFLLRLPNSAEPVVRDWLQVAIPKSPILSPTDVIAQFEAAESKQTILASDQKRDLATQGIAYLLAEPPPDEWIAFLSTEIGSKADAAVAPPAQASATLFTLEDVATAFAIDRREHPTRHLNQVINAFLALESGDSSRAQHITATIEDTATRRLLERTISRHVEASSDVDNVLRPLAPLSPAEDVSIEDVELIGTARLRSTEDSPAFIKVAAFAHDDTLYLLDRERELEWLDGQPEIIAFPNTPSLRLPLGTEVNSWVVERFKTNQAIKVRATRNGRLLYTMVQLDSDLSQPDQLREEITQANIPAGVRPIFQLKSGVALRVPTSAHELSDRDFDEPVEVFRKYTSWAIGSARVVLGPLPPPDSYCDCGDIMTVLRRLLRSKKVQSHLPKMTNAHVQSLLVALRADTGGLTPMRIDRVVQSLSMIVESRNRLDTLVPELMATPEIKAEVEKAKAVVLAEFVAEESKARADRDRLKKEIADLVKKRDLADDEVKSTAAEVRKAVKRSFEKAKAAGIASIGDVAFFTALIGGNEPDVQKDSRVSVVRMSADRTDLAGVLGALGVPIVKAKAAEYFVKAILSAGLPLIIRGPLALPFGQAIGRGTCVDCATLVRVPIGLLDDTSVTPALADAQSGDALVIAGFNASPFETYGGPITDRILKNLNGAKGKGVHVVLTAVEGPIGLPVAVDLASLSAAVDTRWLMSGDDLETSSESDVVLSSMGGNMLRANALGHVATVIDGIEEPFRRIATTFLTRQAAATD